MKMETKMTHCKNSCERQMNEYTEGYFTTQSKFRACYMWYNYYLCKIFVDDVKILVTTVVRDF